MGAITRRSLLLGAVPAMQSYRREDLEKLRLLYEYLMLHVSAPARRRVHRRASEMYEELVRAMRT